MTLGANNCLSAAHKYYQLIIHVDMRTPGR